MLAPVTTTALPVALRLAGAGIRGSGAIGSTSGILGGFGRGKIIAAILGALGGVGLNEMVDQLVDMFGDDSEAQKVLAILSAIEDAMGTGAIMVPEPPRGYSGEIYQVRLNYFHANLNDGKLWLSDYSNGKNSWR